jgi:hypothetical protein
MSGGRGRVDLVGRDLVDQKQTRRLVGRTALLMQSGKKGADVMQHLRFVG